MSDLTTALRNAPDGERHMTNNASQTGYYDSNNQWQDAPAPTATANPQANPDGMPQFDGGYYTADGQWVETGHQSHPAEPRQPQANPWVPQRPVPRGVTGDGALHTRQEVRAARIPTNGWRGFVYRATGGSVNPGLSRKQMEAYHEFLRTRIDAPVDVHRITVNSAKGGIGKTTIIIALGTAYAMLRRDQAVAVDANPDIGTLAMRVGLEKATTIRDLLTNIQSVRSANDLRAYLSQAQSRLEVLAAEDDPAQIRAFTPEEYQVVQNVLGTYRQIILSDTGIDMTAPVLDGIMAWTGSLVIASNTTPDGQKLTRHTLDAWETRAPDGHRLVSNSVVAVTLPSGKLSKQDQDDAVAEYKDRVGKVVFIPFDRYLDRGGRAEDGGVFVWDRLARATQDAYLELAAAVADTFPPLR